MPRRPAAALFTAFAIGCILLTPPSVPAQTPGDQIFTIIVLPDTQNYAAWKPAALDAQTQWIADNAEALNIVLVLHEGDIVGDDTDLDEWQNASTSFALIDDVVPWVPGVGNHDYHGGRDSTLYNQYFPVARFSNWPTFGGVFEAGKMDNSYQLFTAGRTDFMAISMEFGPRDAVLAWVAQLIQQHPTRRVMLVTHAYLGEDGERMGESGHNPHFYGLGECNDGEEIWDELIRHHDSIDFIFSGHVSGGDGDCDPAAHPVALSDGGNPVHQIVANYQYCSGSPSEGALRILTFDAAQRKVSVTTYSPYHDVFMTDSENQFELVNLDLFADPEIFADDFESGTTAAWETPLPNKLMDSATTAHYSAFKVPRQESTLQNVLGSPAMDTAEQIAAAASLQVEIMSTTSRSFALSWNNPPGITGTRIYLAPEPPAAPTATMPGERLIADLPPTQTDFTLSDLAPAVHHFVRIEADSPTGTQREIVHVKTAGGLGAELSGPLSEVSLYGPHIIRLNLVNEAYYNGSGFNSYTGDDWQGGTWTVNRGNGSSITVSEVHRHSVPVSQPNYQTGWQAPVNNNDVVIDHRIFLVLDQPIGERDVLQITHSGAGAETTLNLTLAYSDRYLETHVIQLNQVGYLPRATERWAYISGWMGDGGGLPLDAFPSAVSVIGEPVGPMRPRLPVVSGLSPVDTSPRIVAAGNSAIDSDTGAEVFEIDISSIPAVEGARYRIHIPGVGVSWPTAVSEIAVFKTFYQVARGLYLNRWYGDLAPQYTEWSRPADHGIVYLTDVNNGPNMFDKDNPPPTDTPMTLEGGHHDAGDFDIRPYHVLVAQYLMRAYELNSSALTDGQLNIPESGNGIPDLLDEALWSIKAWEALQNDDGGVRRGVESIRHPNGYYLANEDQLDYWTFNAIGDHTAYCSGLFAQASYLVKDFDSTKSSILEQRSIDAYNWASTHGAPAEFAGYAAGELTRLTGSVTYETEYQTHWNAVDVWGRGLFEHCKIATEMYPGDFADKNGVNGESHAMADFAMAYAKHQGSGQIYDVTVAQLTERATTQAAKILNSAHAHRTARFHDEGVYWGRGTNMSRFMDSIYQRLDLGNLTAQEEQQLINALSLAADYVLGANPAGMSMITGLGTKYPWEVLHTDSLVFIKNDMPPMPGIPVYGPIDTWPDPPYYDAAGAAFYPEFSALPRMRRMAITRPSVNMSEFTVWETQAPLAGLFASLIAPGITAPEEWLPGGSEHQNPLPPHFDPYEIFSDGFENGNTGAWSASTGGD